MLLLLFSGGAGVVRPPANARPAAVAAIARDDRDAAAARTDRPPAQDR